MTTPADELRAAAQRLRQHADKAGQGLVAAISKVPVLHGKALPDPAAMHPLVGRALADWLTTEAETWVGDEVHSRCSSQTCTLNAALAVARAITGNRS